MDEPPAPVAAVAPASHLLVYAPPAKNQKLPCLVVVFGIVTTALTLWGVYTISSELNMMGWYAARILPVGASLVGVAAATGYGIGSYFTGVRIHGWLLWTILGLQIGGYFAAHYIEFLSLGPVVSRATGKSLTFPAYFDSQTTHMSWEKSGTERGEQFGKAGYCFRFLEVVGFALGGMVVPLTLMATPYCDLCQRYMKTKSLGLIPASIPARRISRSNTVALEEYNRLQEEAAGKAEASLNHLRTLMVAGDVKGFQDAMKDFASWRKSTMKLPRRVDLTLVRCKGCGSGHVTHRLQTGHGSNASSIEIGRSEVSNDFMRALIVRNPGKRSNG